MKRITIVSIIAGVIAGIITLWVFGMFPNALVFFLIPGLIGLAVDKFGKAKNAVTPGDDTNYERLARLCGLLCGGITLTFVMIPTAVIFHLAGGTFLLLNPFFDGVCVLSVFWGYRRGRQAILDAYYQAVIDED